MGDEVPKGGVKSPSEVGAAYDFTQKKRVALQEESLLPLKEYLAEWLSKTLDIDISAENFMDVLDNGVYLCDLINVVHRKAEECIKEGQCNDEIPKVQLKCKRDAQSGSWIARDNSANFLERCKALGMHSECTFESEDLAMPSNEMSRSPCAKCYPRFVSGVFLDRSVMIQPQSQNFTDNPRKSLTDVEIEKKKPIVEAPPPKPKAPTSARSRPLNLDEEVRKLAAKCHCSDDVKRREGKYMVFGKVLNIRLFDNGNLMVPVGGGWERLEQYLIKHNPVLVVEHKRKKRINLLRGMKSFNIKAQYKN